MTPSGVSGLMGLESAELGRGPSLVFCFVLIERPLASAICSFLLSFSFGLCLIIPTWADLVCEALARAMISA